MLAATAGAAVILLTLTLFHDWGSQAFAVSAMAAVLGGLAVAPIALPLVWLSERFAWRHLMAYLAAAPLVAICGILVGTALVAAFEPLFGNHRHALHDNAIGLWFTTATVAACVYWYVSGRFSGLGTRRR